MKIPKLRWIIAGMLLLATMINYTDRLALSVVSVDVRKEFSLNEQDYSHVITMFLIAYAIMYAGSGYIVDRLGTRRGFSVFIFAWSMAQMLHAFVRGKWSLGGCRFLLGLSEPGNWPAAAKAVARQWFDWTPPQVTSVSGPRASASATWSSSLRALFPESSSPVRSSRL